MKTSPVFPHRSPGWRRSGGFTVMEMMVSVTLLAVIMAALFASFYQVQRAVRVGAQQKDVAEAARSGFLLLTRQLQLAQSSGQDRVTNFLVRNVSPGFLQPLAEGGTLTNILQEASWLTRNDSSDWDLWSLDGFFVSTENDRSGAGLVGSLYRYSASGYRSNLFGFQRAFDRADESVANHMLDGVINLQFKTYDARGVLYSPTNIPVNVLSNLYIAVDSAIFVRDYLPSFVELEMSVLEPDALKQYQARVINPTVAKQFLADRAHQVHIFRQRIPLRNHHEP